ncbi:MAG TPA: HAMP domain-containing sensor histidine kinase [Clostridia bacterium]|nr:HAMP domain-containing sensor histidine kinase [Clostridia bacterium]
MKKKMRNSFMFRQYFTVTSLIILLSFSILGSALLVFGVRYWVGDKESLMSENVKSVSSTTSYLVESSGTLMDNSDSVRIICNMLSTISPAIDADVFIANMDGNVIYCQHILKQNMVVFTGKCPVHSSYHIPQDVVEETVENGYYSKLTRLDGLFMNYNFVVAQPIYAHGESIGITFATQPILSGIKGYLIAIIQMFLLSSLLALLIALASTYFLTYRLTNPLREMATATKRYAQGDFSYRVDVSGRGELADLSKAFNSMAKELATLESTRRSFVANVSHELKTPMTTIGGFIDGILDGTIENDRHEHYLDVVSDEVKRLSRLVTSMLNMSKIEAGELSIEPTQFNISEMIFKTTLAFEQIIENKSIEIAGMDTIENIVVQADEDMINQAIYNLIDNAVKFTPFGGKITFNGTVEKDNAIISIKNTGLGIPSDEIDRVFDRFYKVDKSRSYDVKGSGLGLYLVKTLIEMHGGQITVLSTENEFTEFIFRLPLM